MHSEEPQRATDNDGRTTPLRGKYEEKAREGSSTPVTKTPAVGASTDVRPRMADGGGEGTRATTYEGAQKSEHGITKDACGRAGQVGREGVPRGVTATSEVAEDIEAESGTRIWWIGRSLRFEIIRRRWWTGRRRWFAWNGWSCSKKADEEAKDSVDRLDRKSHVLSILAHTGGCAVRWGRMS